MSYSVDYTGGVIWVTGYSAAGKTTVGRHVNRMLNASGRHSLFLDGDQLRSIFANKWGYEKRDRIELACTYFRLCSHLSKQGVVVVISAVAMLDEARQWFRQNVENGIEVYLRVPLDERMSRDNRTKKIYATNTVDMGSYTEPSDPDIVIDNYGEMSSETAARSIVDFFRENETRESTDYGRKAYWERFYESHKAVSLPSPFAEYCLPMFSAGQRILEIGCGNGRDAFFFARSGFDIVALDKSEEAIKSCRELVSGSTPEFVCGEASDPSLAETGKFQIVYSRFSLHAMTATEENAALTSAFALLAPGGLLCIECRSINDPLSRKGEVISPTERIDGHYRRFIVLEELTEKLTGLGFSIIESIEADGLAVFREENPVVIRIIATRKR